MNIGIRGIIAIFDIDRRGDVSVPCPEGKRSLGGGYYLTFNEGYWDELRIFGSSPMPDGNGWFFRLD